MALLPSITPPAILQIIFSGGAMGVAITLALLGLSIISAYLIFDQIMTLRRREVVPTGLSEAVRQSLAKGAPADADKACKRQPSVLAYSILSGLAEGDAPWEHVEKAVEDAMVEQSARLMRRIEYLSVIGNIAPMVGLLGTVTGMILAFQQVAGSDGTAGASQLAEGIYHALVTTVGGLLVAIPSLAAFAILRNRVDALIAEVAHQASYALQPIKRRGQRPATRPAFQGAPKPPAAANPTVKPPPPPASSPATSPSPPPLGE